MFGPAITFMVAIVCVQVTNGNPIIFRDTTDGDASEENNFLEIEISPYVFKEFMKKTKIQELAFIPLPSDIILEDEEEEKENSKSTELVESKVPYEPYESVYITGMKNPSTPESTTSKSVINGITNYGDRFLSADIKAKACPTDHTYSTLMKRCLRKYNSRQSSTIVG